MSDKSVPVVNGRFMSRRSYLLLKRAKHMNKIITERKIQNAVQQSPERQTRRRIVEIDYLASQLTCMKCRSPLLLSDIASETHRGFASLLYIKCSNPKCQSLRKVYTCKMTSSRQDLYDVNLKVAVGILDAGIGATQLNALFSCMNMPTICETTLKRHERVVSSSVEKVAKESFIEAARLEKELTSPGKPIVASADMGWQKRGNGFKYDSLTGHSSLIGAKTGKILTVQVMSSTCAACTAAGEPCKKLTCKRNHTGSAKSMEAAAAVLMLQSDDLREAEVEVGVLVGDADSSTAAAVRIASGGKVERALDLAHVQKTLKNDLWKLQPTYKNLNANAIDYIRASVGTVVKKHHEEKGSAEDLKRKLQVIPQHVFKDHSLCSPLYCKFLQDPQNYKSKYLNTELGDTSSSLYQEVMKCYQKVVNVYKELNIDASTKPNESFNATVRSKVSKSRHYGGSERLSTGVNCAALQKNKTVTYTTDIMLKCGLSPGLRGLAYKTKLKYKRQYEREKRKLPASKVRRKIQAAKRNQHTARKERREGDTYRSGMAMSAETNPPDVPPDVRQPRREQVKKIWIPTPLESYAKQQMKLKNVEEFQVTTENLTFFDCETSGLSPTVHEILQISAKNEIGTFNVYITPLKSVDNSNVHSISFQGGKLYHKLKPVVSVTLKLGLLQFLAFIKDSKITNLAAHNALFDMRFLYEKLKECSLLDEAECIISGYVDTVKLVKLRFPLKDTVRPEKYKLGHIAKFLFGPNFEFDMHNAEADSAVLMDIALHLVFNKDEIKKCGTSFTIFRKWRKHCALGAELETLASSCSLKTTELRKLISNDMCLERMTKICNNETYAEMGKFPERIFLEKFSRKFLEIF